MNYRFHYRCRNYWELLAFIEISPHREQVVELIPAGWIAARVRPQFSQVDCSLAVHPEFTGRGKNPTKTGKFLPMVNIPRLIP